MHLRNNRIQQLEVDGVSLFTHDARVAAVTVHYSGILGCKDNTRWAFDVDINHLSAILDEDLFA
jgi:hypothetical protein